MFAVFLGYGSEAGVCIANLGKFKFRNGIKHYYVYLRRCTPLRGCVKFLSTTTNLCVTPISITSVS